MPFILAIDQGTHATRATLFTTNGQLIQHTEQKVALSQLDHKHIEQDPEEILESITSVIKQLNAEKLSRTVFCGLATQRSTIVAWHIDTGKSLNPAISWQDRRSNEDLQQFNSHIDNIKKITGLPLSPHYGAGKFRWLLANNTNIKKVLNENKLCLGTLASYLIFNLLKENIFVVDHSNAHRTLLFDLQSLNWSDKLLSLFDINKNTLPTCKPIEYQYGKLALYNIPLTMVCGDQNAAVYSQGPVDEGHAIINIGTGAFVIAPCHKNITNSNLLCGVAHSSNFDVCEYLLEGTVNGAGSALSWAQKKYPVTNLFEKLPHWLEQIKTSEIFINTIGGLGSPWWKAEKQAYFISHKNTEVEHKYVAIIESIVFLLQHNIEQMQQHISLTQLKVSGGLSQLDGLCQKLADISNLPVARAKDTEATARGTAWLAAGRPDNWMFEQADKNFKPQNNADLILRYRQFTQEIRSI
jgi:glycerol kinase